MKILIASPIDPEALEALRAQNDVICAFDAAPDVLASLIRDRQALIFRSGVSISAGLMECAPDLRLLVRAGSGTDNLDLAYVRRRGLELVRIPEPGAKAVAEMSLCLMLALSRNLLEADRSMRDGRWLKHQLEGYLLAGKTLGIVGVGNIGLRVGLMGLALGMVAIGCVEHPSAERSTEFAEVGLRLTDLDEVVAEADYISIHVPLKDTTRNLVNADLLARMKPGSYLINLARGGVVDEEALRGALLDGGRLRGAALDVHKAEGPGKVSPLADLPNVILTPHMGAMTFDSQREIGRRIIEIVTSFASTEVQCGVLA